MIRTIIFFICLTISLLISMIFAGIQFLLGLVGAKKMQKVVINNATRIWSKIAIFITGNRVRKFNTDVVPEGTVLYVVNHQGYFDIPALMSTLPKSPAFVAKVELEKIPMISYWMKKMGCLFMDRGNMRQSLKIILQGIEMLKDGQSMVIFPEGTRSKSNEVGEFKAGSLKLAMKAGVPIVPVTLKNSFKVFEEHNRIRTAEVSIKFHEPIYTEHLSKEEMANLHVEVRNIIAEGMEHML